MLVMTVGTVDSIYFGRDSAGRVGISGVGNNQKYVTVLKRRRGIIAI